MGLRFILVLPMLMPLLFSPKVARSQATMASVQESAQEMIWHVKAIHPDGYTMDVKAVGEDGKRHDVKAFEDGDQKYIMEVKAFFGKQTYPLKVLVSESEYKPVVAITDNGSVIPIMAITREGKFMPVRGVRKSGYIVHIKAVGSQGEFYGVKAISKEGLLNDVKGVKMYDKQLEATIQGQQVHAHVVALPQMK